MGRVARAAACVAIFGGCLVSGGAAKAAGLFWTGTYSELNQFSSDPAASYPGYTDRLSGSSSLTVDYAASGKATVKQAIDLQQVITQHRYDGSVEVDTTTITGSSQTEWPVADAYPLGLGPGVDFVRGTRESSAGTCRLAQAQVDDPFTQAPLIAQQIQEQSIYAPDGQLQSQTTSPPTTASVGGPLSATQPLKATLHATVLQGTTKQTTSYPYGFTGQATTTMVNKTKTPTPLRKDNGHGASLPLSDPNGRLYGVLPSPIKGRPPVIISVYDLGHPQSFTQQPIVLTRATNGCLRPYWHLITGKVTPIPRTGGKGWNFTSEVLFPYSGRPIGYQTTVRLSRTPPK